MSRKLISLDQASRLLSEVLTVALTTIEAEHSVRGVSIFHIGQHYFVDLNLHNESDQRAWSLSLQLEADVPEEAVS
jgi:hypothetical protein